AIGALMAGLEFGDSKYIKRMEHRVIPYKDVYGAMFFCSFGLSIYAMSLCRAVMWSSIAAELTILVNLASVYFATKISSMKKHAIFDIGFTLSARGEFSIIMANIGKAGGLNPIIQSFVVVYVLILSIVAPLLTKESRNFWKLTFGRNEKDKGKPISFPKRLDDLEKRLD